MDVSSDDEEYFWYSEPEIEEDEVWNPEGDEWTQSIHSDSNTNPRVQTGNGDEFSQFANWHYGMPPPRLNPPPRPSIPHSNERDYAELRRRKFLCLHYFFPSYYGRKMATEKTDVLLSTA